MSSAKKLPVCIFLLFHLIVKGQETPDSFNINYSKFHAFALNGDIKSAMELLPGENVKLISARNLEFTEKYKKRFYYPQDSSDLKTTEDNDINKLLDIYRRYWRSSLLDPAGKYDSVLKEDLIIFLQQSYQPAKAAFITLEKDSVDKFLSKYITEFIESKSFYTTESGYGKTGGIYDLLLWRKHTDTTYNISLGNEAVNVKLFFMEDFVSLGWMEYATFGYQYPGGWATKEALYCVKQAYDVNSESFKISYLKHEARHFADYKLFPKLSSADLEYRAKLTELIFLKKNLYNIVNYFIDNANEKSGNSHLIAHYYLIGHLSKSLFRNGFENDINNWKKIPVKKINRESKKLLKRNTRQLQKLGADVEYFIQPKIT
jgi:hypothetical protein